MTAQPIDALFADRDTDLEIPAMKAAPLTKWQEAAHAVARQMIERGLENPHMSRDPQEIWMDVQQGFKNKGFDDLLKKFTFLKNGLMSNPIAHDMFLLGAYDYARVKKEDKWRDRIAPFISTLAMDMQPLGRDFIDNVTADPRFADLERKKKGIGFEFAKAVASGLRALADLGEELKNHFVDLKKGMDRAAQARDEAKALEGPGFLDKAGFIVAGAVAAITRRARDLDAKLARANAGGNLTFSNSDLGNTTPASDYRAQAEKDPRFAKPAGDRTEGETVGIPKMGTLSEPIGDVTIPVFEAQASPNGSLQLGVDLGKGWVLGNDLIPVPADVEQPISGTPSDALKRDYKPVAQLVPVPDTVIDNGFVPPLPTTTPQQPIVQEIFGRGARAKLGSDLKIATLKASVSIHQTTGDAIRAIMELSAGLRAHPSFAPFMAVAAVGIVAMVGMAGIEIGQHLHPLADASQTSGDIATQIAGQLTSAADTVANTADVVQQTAQTDVATTTTAAFTAADQAQDVARVVAEQEAALSSAAQAVAQEAAQHQHIADMVVPDVLNAMSPEQMEEVYRLSSTGMDTLDAVRQVSPDQLQIAIDNDALMNAPLGPQPRPFA